jgi:hypothetical protein
MPCDTCVKRNVEPNCQYAANAVRGKPHVSRQRALNDRLKRLEESIQSFVGEGKVLQAAEKSQNYGNENRKIDHLNTIKSRDIGRFEYQPQEEIAGTGRRSQSVYVDPSHWASILGDIKEVRESLSTDDTYSFKESTDESGEQTELNLAIGSQSYLSIDDILVVLPARPICDLLVSQYFNYRYMVLGM